MDRHQPQAVMRDADARLVPPGRFGRRAASAQLTQFRQPPLSEAEMTGAWAKSLRQPSPIMRLVKWAGGWLGIIIFVLFAKFSVNGILDRLPTCDSTDVKLALGDMTRDRLVEAKVPFKKIEIVNSEAVPGEGDVRKCRAAVHVDGRFASRVSYEIAWTNRLLSRYRVGMRFVPN